MGMMLAKPRELDENRGEAIRLATLQANAAHHESTSCRAKLFRTISIMVNARCNLSCPHCDLPSRFSRYGRDMEASAWSDLLEALLPQIDPEVVSVAAMEPLLPHGGQERTVAVLQGAARHGVPAGFVTNGVYARDFFTARADLPPIDFMDVSVDGPPEIDARVRGPGHFALVDDLFRSNVWRVAVNRVYASCVLTRWNSEPRLLSTFLEWMKRTLEEPRLVLLLLYPNEHVDRSMFLNDEDLLRTIDLLVRESRHFAEILLECFPSSVPGLAKLVEQGVLPGDDELLRDDAGMLYGHVEDNLFVRYANLADFELFHLRITPEGDAIPPENLERADYLTGSYGSIQGDGWQKVRQTILERSQARMQRQFHSACGTCPCATLCRSENYRCPLIREQSVKLAIL